MGDRYFLGCDARRVGHNMILRDYQIRGVEDIRAALRRGVKNPLYVLPTGGGKTILFSYIAREAAKKGKRVCILVHRRELLLQTCAKLEHDHGRISAGFDSTQVSYAKLIQVATVQTLVRRLEKYRHQFDLIIIDEAHHATASTYLKIIEAHPNAVILGVTATPMRMSGKGLGDLFSEIIEGPTVAQLTKWGYLVPAEVYAPSSIDVSGIKKTLGDFQKTDLARVVDKPKITGDAVKHYKLLADGVPAIAFCVSLEHAEHVAESFREADYRSRRIDGTLDQHERDACITDLSTGRLDVLTSCDLISEGLDVPVVGCGIMLRPTLSTILAIQQPGRILRPYPGKRAAIILDHAGNCLRHGLPTTPREWSLETRRPARDTEQDIPKIRQCEKCYFVHPTAPVCPYCGYVYPGQPRKVEQVDGDLEKIEAVRIQKAKRRENGQAHTLEDFIRIGKERDYKPGWAHRMFAIRQKKRGGAAV